MTITKKISIMIAVPIVAIGILVMLGWTSLRDLRRLMDRTFREQFVTFVDEEITPLIDRQMLPVINHDVVRIEQLRDSIGLMLEADRDAHQAVIAEKMALVATEDTAQAANAANLENVQQVEQRMTTAAVSFDSDEIKAQ